MGKSHDELEDVESTPLEMETPMNGQMVQAPVQQPEIFTPKPLCGHQRLIDDVRTRSGKPTGKVRCLECGTIFDDPCLSAH